ncbi:hypothetical protein CVT25_001991 [Psilocybe cyanescens]|uniref:HNH nuclease domain-containing protein n=1 Tax=Psilocybe cyanescens TaxID=93625 RepID=A0A409VUL9_PSICY|nr:hypothetical protein CVT25_001991 [Psilocybe cyanescens]
MPRSPPQPLPRPNPYHPDTQSITHSAYTKCLDLETRHNQVAKSADVRLEVLICARFLGYMLLEAPTDNGREDFAWEVFRCTTDIELQQLAQIYNDHLLRIFRRNKGCTPTPRSHPSVPSFDLQKDELKHLLVDTPNSHMEAKTKALQRDGYRCVVSKRIDYGAFMDDLIQAKEGDMGTVTHLAHIFDRSTNENLGDSDTSSYAASVHAVLLRFGQLRAIEELDGPGLHRLENVMTMDASVHLFFDNLEIWFERNENDPIHHYRLETVEPFLIAGLPRQIEFTTPDPDQLPLPDPRYLALHAACARVAHLSGAGEYIAKILRDLPAVGVLAEDGGSDVLYHALVRC